MRFHQIDKMLLPLKWYLNSTEFLRFWFGSAKISLVCFSFQDALTSLSDTLNLFIAFCSVQLDRTRVGNLISSCFEALLYFDFINHILWWINFALYFLLLIKSSSSVIVIKHYQIYIYIYIYIQYIAAPVQNNSYQSNF